ncbi:MAG TPA: sulfatase [Jatrophihabitans sp.]|nr:sulfatase [Jatrophihabitans sp.]
MTPARRLRPHRLAAAGLAVLLTLSACAKLPSASGPAGSRPIAPVGAHRWTVPAAPPPGTGKRRNIVLILTDDLSTNLVPYMPHVQAMMDAGMSFTNYTVTNSLCCPSRSSIFTGEFPHNTGVQTNLAPNGGYYAFQAYHDETHTFAVTLQKAGYRTGFYGKYLNGYSPVQEPANPPGWTDWGGVDGGGYAEHNFNISLNGKIVHYGYGPRNYTTTVLDRLGRRFIDHAAAAGSPFALEISTFAPHHPAVPARQDRFSFPDAIAPRTQSYDVHPTDAPHWLAKLPPLSETKIARGDNIFRRRVRCVQAVDRLIGHIEDELRATHQLSNTVLIFSSDNGFHIGEHGLFAGKLTPYETDVNVPLVVDGPGIAPGSVDAHAVENIDLAPTFDELGESPIPADVDGHSFVPLLYGEQVSWRTLADVEHAYTGGNPHDPDFQPFPSGRLPPYRALRSPTFTYVEYAGGDREYYDRVNDPEEMHNIYSSLSPARVAELHAELVALSTCAGYAQCWSAGLPTG